MTKEEAIKFLKNTKVYVKDNSREIQAKLFTLGLTWPAGKKYADYADKPFLYINRKFVFYMSPLEFDDLKVKFGSDNKAFRESDNREITAEDILNITIDEPKSTYRPFKDVEECWNEMLKHKPFGWTSFKGESHNIYNCITFICKRDSPTFGRIEFANEFNYSFDEAFQLITFADGTPFGIKED